MKKGYSVYVWRLVVNRENGINVEPKPILIAEGLNTKNTAKKFIEFYKSYKYKLRGAKYEICEDGKEPVSDENDA